MHGTAPPPPAVEGSHGRSGLLLPLFRALTELSTSSMVWKNADLALAGVGDVDWMAPQVVWPSIVAEVRRWADGAGLGPVIVCNHLPDGMFVIALNGHDEFFQLDLRSRVSFRGATVFGAEDLVQMARMDPQGFRRLRPGAEGLLKLVLKGLTWGGRPRLGKLQSEGVLPLLEQDAAGVRDAAALFKPASTALISAAGSFSRGNWDQSAMLMVEVACSVKAMTQPGDALRRARFRAYGMKRCPVIQASVNGFRRPPAKDYTSWLGRVSECHQVFTTDTNPPDRG